MREKPLVITLKVPVTWQQDAVIQKAINEANYLLEKEAKKVDVQQIWLAWRGQQGLLKYHALERQFIKGNQIIFPKINLEGFELITAVLLSAMGEELDEAKGDMKTALLMHTYQLSLNLLACKAVSEAQSTRAKRLRKDWSEVERIAKELQSKFSPRNLASAVAARTGEDGDSVRRHLRKTGLLPPQKNTA